MTVRVRFAPSPTGYLHIGGARTAMYNYLFAKAMGGKYILRIEDTDLERSKREYEEAQIQDLKWLGITHDEGPDVGGNFGPYRQSERGHIYSAWAQKLIDTDHAYHCFCTEEELNQKKEQATLEKRPPHYDGKCRNLSQDEANAKLLAGEQAVIRFKAPRKAYVFNDHVRGRVVFPEGMVGDFVIMRANGVPVYNYAVVVDDAAMEITHVIRAEEHLPNTLRQLMLYEAFNVSPPEFAHVSLLIGEDRQKLSKRHGATSVNLYKEMNYLPAALLNYLLLLGWSHPEEKDVFNIFELGALFNIDRFTKAAAIYDINKLNFINGQHLRKLPLETMLNEMNQIIPPEHLFFNQTMDWKMKAINLLKDQINFFPEMIPLLNQFFDIEEASEQEYLDMKALESTVKIKALLKSEILKLKEQNFEFLTEEIFASFSDKVKSEVGVKGKPLFMGIRSALTLKAHGPELKFIIPLTPVDVLIARLDK